MALVVADRVWETTSTSGTGTLTLSGAVSGYQTFAVIGNSNTTYYTIVSGADWEVGIGTYTSSGTTLSRDTVLSSSAGDTTKISVVPGSFVFCDYPASKAVYEDASGNVDGYPITGGTINSTSIGATTPAAGTFTTITGQTEVLKGTGQNLVTQSQTFSTWATNAFAVTANTIVAPDSTTTAATLTGNGLSNTHTVSFLPSASGITRTWSCYLKAGTNNFAQLMFGTDTTAYANFDLSTGALGTVGATATATISNAGNGWYRCSVTTTSTTATSVFIVLITSSTAARFETNSLATTVFAWGAQLELGSTLNTYIPTTTTAIYGTPTLSFSGVAGLGLQSDGSLYVSPAGTGALQAQATTSSTVGGNARGANAVDWSTSRGAASQVASGTGAGILSGVNISSTGFGSVVGGGSSNQATNSYTSIFGGLSNSASSAYAFVGGGVSNTAAGIWNFIGAGWQNSGTANAAVTTQATTAVTSGSTAVTLSGSNANIKVGQLISGTGIPTGTGGTGSTYVAAISGTALTLSQNASATGTPTLTFYTPHGVVVGGGNNQATGSYSFIGGGGDAGTAANRNVASGDWSFVGGGCGNTASGIAAVICGGGRFSTGFGSNIASGLSSGIVSGLGNTATAIYSFVGAGNSNTANATGSFIGGGYYGTARSILGNHVFPACVQPIASAQGVSQAALLVLGVQTTDATATALRSDTNAASATNQVILPNNSAYYFKGSVIANVTGAANGAAWSIEGAIMRGANAASTVLIGTPSVNRVAASTGATAWAVAITADTTNGGLRVTVTGVAATTIRWVAKLETTEVTF